MIIEKETIGFDRKFVLSKREEHKYGTMTLSDFMEIRWESEDDIKSMGAQMKARIKDGINAEIERAKADPAAYLAVTVDDRFPSIEGEMPDAVGNSTASPVWDDKPATKEGPEGVPDIEIWFKPWKGVDVSDLPLIELRSVQKYNFYLTGDRNSPKYDPENPDREALFHAVNYWLKEKK